MQFLSLSGGAIGGIVAGAVALLLIIIAIWYITTKNKLVSLRNDTEEAFSTMDVHMKKRYDLIPNLVETCKGYTKHEGETLSRVTAARNACIASTGNDRVAAERELGMSLHTLLNSVRENYPELKADRQFMNLANQLEQIEHEIAQSRKFYNAVIKKFNTKIEQFPSSIVAGRMKLERKLYFELDDVSERVAPRVSFQ
ncbi:MAG: LemA family protein [Clostridiales bacterium]|nr:LemA family protein [Clostridiales bacterium]